MKVYLNSPGYTYDVHSLVKAFYPYRDVKILSPDLLQNDDKAAGDAYEKEPLTEDNEQEKEGIIKVICSAGDISGDEKVGGRIECSYSLPGEDRENKTGSALFENADRTYVKSLLKRVLYELLSDVTGVSLPWGTLTGIRPTKIPMKLIAEGKSDGEIYDYMKEKYICSDEKIALSTDIAHRELKAMGRIDKDSYSLYVGIPFCPTTCLYCSFTSFPIASWKKRTGEYISALKKELDYVSIMVGKRGPDSIYIGGGTPTTLSAGELSDLIGYIREKFDLTNVRELTVEAGRPDSITKEKLESLYAAGVSRLSINPQTMNDKTLKVIGRRHTVAQIYEAFKMAREAGFDNINTDLIMGLPGEDIRDVRYTYEKIKELAPDSITVHSMAIKRAAGMHRFLEEHEEIKSENTPEMMEIADSCAKELGMKPYYLYRQKNMAGNFENVGYAKEGKYGIYNMLIMEEVQSIIACGAGCVTKRVFTDDEGNKTDSSPRIERCDNVKDVSLYIEKIDEMIDRKRQLFSGFAQHN